VLDGAAAARRFIVFHRKRAQMPVRVPVVLLREEVRAVMRHLDGVSWLVVALLYGAGLRLQECPCS
jgi:hypothetical protein